MSEWMDAEEQAEHDGIDKYEIPARVSIAAECMRTLRKKSTAGLDMSGALETNLYDESLELLLEYLKDRTK